MRLVERCPRDDIQDPDRNAPVEGEGRIVGDEAGASGVAGGHVIGKGAGTHLVVKRFPSATENLARDGRAVLDRTLMRSHSWQPTMS